MNTFDDDNDLGIFDEPRRRPPRERSPRSGRGSGHRRPPRNGPRRRGPASGSTAVLRLAGLLVIGIAIVFGLVLSCSGGSKGDYSAYIDAMRPLAQDSASIGAKFATALGTPGLTLETFTADLTSWSKQEQADYVAAQRLRPPGPLQSAHAEALATFYLREVSLANLASHLQLATANHDSVSIVAAALAGDAQLLSTSDVMWEQLYRLPATQTLTTQNVTGVVVPGSKIVTSPDIVDAHQLATLYQRVGTPTSNGHVTGVHGSNLIGTNAVESGVAKPLSTSSGSQVFCCSNLVIDVVFENSGNFPEVSIPVTLTIKKVGGDTLYTHTNTVSQIGKGAQATVSFSGIQLPPSAFGHSAEISVSIAKVRGEARLDNNEATYPVFFRLS